jgi:hypothetical protein
LQSASTEQPQALASKLQPLGSRQLSTVQAMPSVQLRAVPVHPPARQASPVVQVRPSLQVVPSGLFGFEQVPVAGLQVPASWHWSAAKQVIAVPEQLPLWQESFWVQALPSLQVVPFGLLGFEQTPVAVLHVPASWH